MLRPDFPEIFDYLTRKAVGYALNTNGTLITPEIAQLLKRRGSSIFAFGVQPTPIWRAARWTPGASTFAGSHTLGQRHLRASKVGLSLSCRASG